MPSLTDTVSMASVTLNLTNVYTMQFDQIHPHFNSPRYLPKCSPPNFLSWSFCVCLFYNPLSPHSVALVCIPVCMGAGGGREQVQDSP